MILLLDYVGVKDDGGGGDNWSCKICNAPGKSSPHQQTPSLLQAVCPSCHPFALPVAQSTVLSHSTDLLTPSSPGVF